jgi:SAM-dependent methyltransferase
MARWVLPPRVRRMLSDRAFDLGRRITRLRKPIRSFARLRSITPMGRDFGLDRGTPIDRYYIDPFLAEHAGDIKGRVLEVATDRYTRRFGGAAVTSSDVLHVDARHPGVTIVGDFVTGAGLQSATFDCIICTQTLQFIYDIHAAMATLHRILKPGGVLLLSVSTIAQVSREDMERWGDYWRMTSRAVRRLLEEQFDTNAIEVRAGGNVLAAVAFLHGLAVEDLRAAEIDAVDPQYELVVCARAVRRPAP